MIDSIQFRNFKSLRDTSIALGPFTLIVGPNGSGKSTIFQALDRAHDPAPMGYDGLITVGQDQSDESYVELNLQWSKQFSNATTNIQWHKTRGIIRIHRGTNQNQLSGPDGKQLNRKLHQVRVYYLDAIRIAAHVQLKPDISLERNGAQLAGVLDNLRDNFPERFEDLNVELNRWLPEFDRILFNTPSTGFRAISLRTKEGQHSIPANHLSQGTLMALAILTLAYLPEPPPLVGFEEPDHGIHPRLLRDVHDALYRLAYPDSYGDKRDPVQVIVTTHSPYFVDLFKDHPEEIVISEKSGCESKFVRLVDLPNIDEILRDAHLGDAWYSGILGGVPCES